MYCSSRTGGNCECNVETLHEQKHTFGLHSGFEDKRNLV